MFKKTWREMLLIYPTLNSLISDQSTYIMLKRLKRLLLLKSTPHLSSLTHQGKGQMWDFPDLILDLLLDRFIRIG
jgi:hypothetical protein